MSLISSAGTTDTAGISLLDPVGDPTNSALYSFGAWVDAVETQGSPLWYDPTNPCVLSPALSGAKWVSTAYLHENPNAFDEWRVYREEFVIPNGVTISSAQLSFTADNAVSVYLNGAEVASTGMVYGPGPADTSNPSTYLWRNVYTVDLSSAVNGVNDLRFVVRNWGQAADNPSGLLYKGTIKYATPAPEFPTALLPVTFIIGFIGAVLLIQRMKEH